MATFRNIKGIQTGFVPGVGEFADGMLKNAPDDFENAAFERVEEEQKTEQPSQPQVLDAPAAPAPSVSPAPNVPVNVPVPPITPQQTVPVNQPAPQTTPVNEESK